MVMNEKEKKMSVHNGEDLDEIVHADAMDQRDSSKMQRPTTSLTAINNELSSFQPRFIPLPHRKRGVDLDQIYEVPDDIASSESESEADSKHHFIHKRKDHVSSSPIAKRLAVVQDTRPEPGTHKEDVESSFISIGQRSFSNYKALPTRKQILSSYQLPTSGQTKLFSNVPIQKATTEWSGADFKGPSSSTTPSLHRGIVTTEDMLKSCPNEVSKTTLAKLAGFWYQEASSDSTKAEVWSRKTVNEHTWDQSPQPSKVEQSCVSQLDAKTEFSPELRMTNVVQSLLQNADEQDELTPVGGIHVHSVDDGSDHDFNNNLDEGDLLVLMSEVEACLPSSDIPRLSSAPCIPRWSPSSSHILPVSGQGDVQPADGELPGQSIVDDCSNGVIGLSDNERDLSSDEDAEMLDLLLLPGEVTETFHPPSSACPRADSLEGESYDSSLQYSEPNSLSTAARAHAPSTGISTDLSNVLYMPKDTSPISDIDPGLLDDQDGMNWEFVNSTPGRVQQHVLSPGTIFVKRQSSILRLTDTAYEMPPSFQDPEPASSKTRVDQVQSPGDNIEEKYQPLTPFGRPNFPASIRDRSPIIGLTSNVLLRVCFRIGEAFLAGGQCDSTKQDAMIELYARVTFSSREEGTVKQHFQFRDFFYDRPPYLNGILENYKSRDLINGESKVFVGERGKGKMVRCLGRLKRDMKKNWKMLIDNVRETDWEEIRHTKRVLTEGWVKEEKVKKTV